MKEWGEVQTIVGEGVAVTREDVVFGVSCNLAKFLFSAENSLLLITESPAAG